MVWEETAVVALCQDPLFQNRVIGATLFPSLDDTSLDFSKVQLNSQYFVGYLFRGQYDIYDSYDAFFRENLLPNAQKIIAQGAKRLREATLEVDKAFNRDEVTDKERNDDIWKQYGIWAFMKRGGMVTPDDLDVGTIVEVMRNDLIKQSHRNTLHASLQSILPLVPELEESAEVLKKARATASKRACVDIFGSAFLKRLMQEKGPLLSGFTTISSLTEDELAKLRASFSLQNSGAELKEAKNEIDLDEEQEEAADPAGRGDDEIPSSAFWGLKGVSMDRYVNDYDDLPFHYDAVPKKASAWLSGPLSVSTYPTFMAPTSGALIDVEFAEVMPSGGGLAVQPIAEEDQEGTVVKGMELSALDVYKDATKRFGQKVSSTKLGRLWSVKKLESDALNDPEFLIKKYTSYAYGVLTIFDDKSCQALLSRISGMTERSTLALETNWFKQHTNLLFDDNCYHVRKLFAALRSMLSVSNKTVRELTIWEKRLFMCIVSARGACGEVVAWMFLGEHILRQLAIVIHDQLSMLEAPGKDWDQGESYMVTELLDELVTFAHGAIMTGIVLRFPSAWTFDQTKGVRSTHLGRWYRFYVTREPRCGNPDCRRLLPDPDVYDNITALKKVASVGVRDSRVGKPNVRNFISENRQDIYPCLIIILIIKCPDEILIWIIIWYARLYHDRICKEARGKRSFTYAA